MAQTITSANSVTGAGIALNVPTSDTITVDATGFLISTGTDAVTISGATQAYIMTVAGMVFSNGGGGDGAIFMTSGTSTLDLTVDPSGTVHGRNFGVLLGGTANITNNGAISGGTAAAVQIGGSGNYYIDNSGLLASDLANAINLSGMGVHTINNYGTIRAGSSVGAQAFASSNTVSTDNIGNFGWIYGGVSLGGGNDGFFGASGRMFGQVLGGDGNDTLTGGIDNDNFNGGLHNDILTGNGGNDTLTGGVGGDTLTGGAGNDTLDGGGGNDLINGGIGFDNVKGGLSNDVFLFNAAVTFANRDNINDFVAANDTIRLENAVFKKLTVNGVLNAAFFKLSTQAKDADDYIQYNKASGALIYDINGSGAGGAVQFATLTTNPTINNLDFFVV